MDKRKMLDEIGMGESLVFDSPEFDEAIVGTTDDDRVVYSYEKMVDCLMGQGLTREEEVEFIDFNTLRSLSDFPNHPVILMNEELFSGEY